MNKCFLDTNFLVYLTDNTSFFYSSAKNMLIKFEKSNAQLFISHEVIEEFIFVIMKFSKLSRENINQNIEKALSKLKLIPNLTIISPVNDLNFVDKVSQNIKKFRLAPKDAYILAVIQENQIPCLATFDQILAKAAKSLNLSILTS